MAAIEEQKATEKRRALGRGLDSLLPSGPRVVTATRRRDASTHASAYACCRVTGACRRRRRRTDSARID